MKKLLYVIVLSILLSTEVFAQANNGTTGTVICPASGSSIEVLARNSSRYSFSLNNTTSTNIRMAYLDGATTPNLTDSNSVIISAGTPWAESLPNVWVGRVVCMSTSGSSVVISYSEARR